MPASTPIHETLLDSDQNIPERFFARQPILDRQKQVFGYEFLFRSGSQNSSCITSSAESDSATRLMVDNSLLYDFEALAGTGKTFLNCTREALTTGLVTLLPARSTVLEILEDIEPDSEVVEACLRLRDLGYQLALDDFVLRPGLERLLPYADYIKIDFRLSDAPERGKTRHFLKGCRARLIAEKIEEEQEFGVAIQEGFDLFQGYFFCRPADFSRNHIPSNHLSYLQILAAVSQSSFEWKVIAKLVRQEPPLSYRLLRMVNSANYMVRCEISSLERALVVVGEDGFRKLIAVALTGEFGKGQPSELIRQTLQRASFCEMAAAHLREDPTEQYLFGLLSLLPAVLGISMPQIVGLLPLRAPVKNALLGESNEVARSLNCFLKHQSGQWHCPGCNGASLEADQMHDLYRRSLLWADEHSVS
ncbi:MAG TPA: HDOD domain-containing protein [Acidobacteriaceae bacterium]|nr:HDOD domain-containing protein [Acidobacteriaceae bacterium]